MLRSPASSANTPTFLARMQHNAAARGQTLAAKPQAIANLERSLAQNRPRALIQMATGSGKTSAIVLSYRLIKFGGARRVLFLVDRANLGRQALEGVPAVRHAGRRLQVHRASTTSST